MYAAWQHLISGAPAHEQDDIAPNPQSIQSMDTSDTTPPPARLRLREVNGMFPTITLTPCQGLEGGATVVLGAPFPRAVKLPGDLGTRSTSHALDHTNIEALHCAINWEHDLHPTVHTIPSAYLRDQRVPSHVRECLGKRLDIEANVYISGKVVDGSKELRIGDVLSFALDSTAPSFRVESTASALKAADGSPATFRLLELDNSLVFETVLPHLALDDLAAFALTNAECADMVAQHVLRPERWTQRPTAINNALDKVSTRQGLLHTLITQDVDLHESVLWSLSKRKSSNCYYARDGAFCSGLQRCVAHASCQLIPQAEANSLRHLVSAMALRMTPASLAHLLDSMRTTTALNAPWPSPYEPRQDEEDSERKPSRLELALAESQMLPRCQGSWTPALLFRYSKAIGATGAAVDYLIFAATNKDEDEAAFDAFTAEVEALWLAATDEVDEQAAFLFGLYEREDGFHGHVDNLIARATSTPPLSLPLIGALTVRLGLCPKSANFPLTSLVVRSIVRCRGVAQGKIAVWADELDEQGGEGWLEQPSRFAEGWSLGHAFPLAFPLEDVEKFIGSLNACPVATSKHFGLLALGWIQSLLEAVRHAEMTPQEAQASLDKAHAITQLRRD